MPHLSVLLMFALAAFILNVTPGPSMLYAFSHSLARGRKAGYASAFGLATGNMMHVMLNAFGLSLLLQKYHVLYLAVKYIGGLYLLYLGITYLINSRKPMNVGHALQNGTESLDLWSFYKKGIFVEFFNPKTALFYISLLPQFVRPECGPVVTQMLILGMCVPLTALMVDLSVSYFTGFVKEKMNSGNFRNKYQEVLSGVLLLFLGGYVMFKK